VKVNIDGQMVEYIQVVGKIIRWMDMVYLDGKMVENI